ncbi:hypothetical protein D5I55_09175 [Chakrabartia godavariana]|nr:hypothetical protein D5I55_09175 [Chakrabartia godavariana]
MRKILILLGTTSLAACSGGGPTTVGGTAVTTGGTGTASTHSFVNPTDPKTYQATGGTQTYQFSTTPGSEQYNQLYAADANTARDTGYQITYNPRDGIFDLALKATKSSTDITTRFQDPAHRTAFGGASFPQAGTPDITSKGVIYFENGSRSGTFNTDGYTEETQTFFYQKPGTTTKYVTYAGYLRNKLSQVNKDNGAGGSFLQSDYDRKRGVFVYGERSGNAAVPTTGTGTFTGQMLASMVYNPLLDVNASTPTFLQWMDGTSTTTVDFAANKFTLALAATVGAPQFDLHSTQFVAMPAGATFTAAGSGRVDLVNAGGFLGQITSAFFTNAGVRSDLVIAGSSIDGAFYGPTAQEVGGGFRVVGGTPDQRIDILGVFTGAR